jgi:hypothetical protein
MEARVPGRAWLEFRITAEDGGSRLMQRALYAPRGVFGRLYWWALLPIHPFVFTSMVAALAEDAERLAAAGVEAAGVEAAPPAVGEPPTRHQ